MMAGWIKSDDFAVNYGVVGKIANTSTMIAYRTMKSLSLREHRRRLPARFDRNGPVAVQFEFVSQSSPSGSELLDRHSIGSMKDILSLN